MVERLIILKTGDVDNDIEPGRLSKGQSFNTDDDDSLPPDTSPQAEDDGSKTSKSDSNFLTPLDQKRSLLSLTSPSMDSVNDPEGSISDIPFSEKIKKKRQRRTIDKSESVEIKRSKPRKLPWFLNFDYTKPLIVVVSLIIVYLLIAYYDVWIPRLLTSNTRVQHSIRINEEKLSERHSAPQTSTTKDSSSYSDDDDNDDDNDNNNDQTTGDSDYKPSQAKLNLRVRRNKMSFSKDRPTKKKRGALYQAVDGDDDYANLDADDDNDDEVDDDGEVNVDPIKEKEVVLASSKKNHRSAQVREQKIKIPTSSKTNLIIRQPEDIVEQLQKLLKSRGKNRDLLTTLTKETGLNKAKLNRFIHGKDYSILTLDNLISFLNSFDSTLLIVSK